MARIEASSMSLSFAAMRALSSTERASPPLVLPSPMCAAASTTWTMASAPSSALQAAATMARSRRRLGANTPGVSISTSWTSSRMAMPRTCVRVVCTFCVTAATLAPTSRFTSVDLPALGAPSTATTAQRRSAIAVLLEEGGRGGPLRVALGAAFAAHGRKALDPRLHHEVRRMLGARLLDDGVVEALAAGRGPFLQHGLGVARRRRGLLEGCAPEARHEGARGFKARIEIERGDHRLADVGEDRLLAAPAARFLRRGEQQRLAEAGRARGAGAGVAVDERVEARRELALVELLVLVQKAFGDD